MNNEIAKRYMLCSNCSDRILSERCDGKCKEYWKYVGAIEQKALDDTELLKLKSSLENEGNIVVPLWFLEIVENTLQIQNNINEPVRKALGESSHDRNIRQSLNVLRKLLNGEELNGMERFEKLK